MRHLAALPLALLVALPASAQDGPVALTPDQIGQIFCLGRIGNDMAPVEGLLTEDLRLAIAAAWAANDAWMDANPSDEKPPLGDGIPWQSWPDYAPDCSVASMSYEMDEARVWIEYGFPGAPDAGFTDTLQLRLVPGGFGWTVWRIDNIRFGTGGDLRSALIGAFSEG